MVHRIPTDALIACFFLVLLPSSAFAADVFFYFVHGAVPGGAAGSHGRAEPVRRCARHGERLRRREGVPGDRLGGEDELVVASDALSFGVVRACILSL